jgi:hypothetical protein
LPSRRKALRRAAAGIVESRTGGLDDYYNALLGYSDDVVDKPRLKIDPTLARTIGAMAELGSPGWLSTATAVLELGWRHWMPPPWSCSTCSARRWTSSSRARRSG